MSIKEEMSTAGVVGTGDDNTVWNKGPFGKWGKHKTFMMTREAFNGIRFHKRKGVHWKGYLGEDEAYKELREYANHTKGPVIVQCETTGACMFVRYSEGNSLLEAVENNVQKTKEWMSALGDAGKDARMVRADTKNNYGKERYLGKFKGHYVRKTVEGGITSYHLQDPKTKKITHSVNGTEKKGMLHIHGAAATGESPVKMHDFYHHLIKHHVNGLIGDNHSEGAKKVWQNLAKKIGKRGSVHGWLNGKPVNLDAQDETETYGPRKRYDERDRRDASEKDAANTKLIATLADEHRSPRKKIVRKKP